MPRVTIITEEELLAAMQDSEKNPVACLYYQHQMRARDLTRRIRAFAADAGRRAICLQEDPTDAFSVRLMQSAADDARLAMEELSSVKEILRSVGGMLDEMAICVPGWTRE